MNSEQTQNDWIEWHGGERPVDGETLVHVKLSNGETHTNCPASHWGWNKEQSVQIVSYFIVTPAPSPAEPQTVPWSKPEHVPGPVCWLRFPGDGLHHVSLVGAIGFPGVWLNGASLCTPWKTLLSDKAEHSTDRLTWNPCTVPLKQDYPGCGSIPVTAPQEQPAWHEHPLARVTADKEPPYISNKIYNSVDQIVQQCSEEVKAAYSELQLAPGHNPNKLTREQVGEGWRLLDEDEIMVGPVLTEIERWCINDWSQGFRGSACDLTYRTRLSRAELRAARGLEAEQPLPKPIQHSRLMSKHFAPALAEAKAAPCSHPKANIDRGFCLLCGEDRDENSQTFGMGAKERAAFFKGRESGRTSIPTEDELMQKYKKTFPSYDHNGWVGFVTGYRAKEREK